MYKMTVLDNGLSVITANMPGMESVAIGIWIAAGGRYESAKQCGISHLLEHMLFRGTKNRSAKELKESIEGRGGVLNGFTGEEYTCYMAKALPRNAALAVDVLSDMTLNPSIALKDFAKEKFVVLEEIKMYIDMPNHYVQELLAELLWPDHPLGRPLAGTKETVCALTQKDLERYRDAMYNPKNIVVSIAGKLPPFNLIKVIEKSFRKAEIRPKQRYIPVSVEQKAPVTNFYFKETEQTHMALGIRAYSRFSADKYSLDLMNIILGGNMSSRLFNEVRDKSGLAYEISSSVRHYNDTGALVISAGIDNKKVGEAVRVIFKVLKGIKARGATRQEFQRAKEFYKGQLLMMFEETLNHMIWLGEKFTCGDPEFKQADIIRRIDEVTVDDIKKVARDIFRSGMINLASVGPIKTDSQKEIKERLLEL